MAHGEVVELGKHRKRDEGALEREREDAVVNNHIMQCNMRFQLYFQVDLAAQNESVSFDAMLERMVLEWLDEHGYDPEAPVCGS